MATVTISLDIPNTGSYPIGRLQNSLRRYAEKLLSLKVEPSQSRAVTKKYNHDMLCGIFSEDSDLDSLRSEYIEEKYGL